MATPTTGAICDYAHMTEANVCIQGNFSNLLDVKLPYLGHVISAGIRSLPCML